MQPFKKFTLNIRGRLVEVDRPMVMGILNVTPDSFFEGSRATDVQSITLRVEQMLRDGVDIVDVGACSTRPGSVAVSEDEELDRVLLGIKTVRSVCQDVIISVDTFRSRVAETAVSAGADIVNDISGGSQDPAMFETVVRLKVPYILTHSRGDAQTMGSRTDYSDVVADVVGELSEKLNRLALSGVADIIIDPGLGFAKTLDQNYRLLSSVSEIAGLLDRPVLIGLSRKSMITRVLNVSAGEALNGTSVLDTVALLRGASILRVHDVREAREAITLVEKLRENEF